MTKLADNSKQTPQRGFRSYSDYRDSGIEWLGNVPHQWAVKRLRFVPIINPVKSELRGLGPEEEVSFVSMESVCERGGLILDQTKPLESVYQGYTYFRNRDIVIAKITPCFENGKGSIAANLTNGVAFGTTELHVLRAQAKLDASFLFYLTISHGFRRLGTGEMYGAGGQKRVPDDFIRDFRTPIPPLSEQRAIAAFLDRETARIDELIAKKQRLIELLAEKRTALISHAVTKGLNPDAPMKDSGIEWLGQVPEHWDVLPLRRRWQVIDCKHRTVPFLDEGIPLASIGEVQEVELDLSNAKRTSEDEYRLLIENDREPKRGDIIYSRNATVGAAAYVNTDETFCMGQDVCMIRSPQQDQRYLTYQLRSPSIMSQLDQIMVGATFKRVNVADIKALTVACPPLAEQQAIGVYCRDGSAQFQALMDTVQLGICRSGEYRSALISAAVTGKIDVREVQK